MSDDSDILLVNKDKYLIRNGARLFGKLVKSSHGKNNSFRIFSLKELQKATNNFSADQLLSNSNFSADLILSDSFRRTYRGTIEDRHVAVKFTWSLHDLLNEVVSLSLIKHRDVVKLLGCCLETDCPILVHELPPKGTLEQNIFPEKLIIPPPVEVSWTDRLRIATEIADALSHLHSELHMTHGRLLDAQAVLLDEFHSAKLCAFEFSKIQNQAESTDVETDHRNKVRKRLDVCGFGYILLDLLSVEKHERSELNHCKEKAEIRKYLIFKRNVFEKERLQIEAFIDLSLRCRSQKETETNIFDGEDELSIEEVARELRSIRSMINPQPPDGNESDNLSGGENASSSNNASTSYQEVTSDY